MQCLVIFLPSKKPMGLWPKRHRYIGGCGEPPSLYIFTACSKPLSCSVHHLRLMLLNNSSSWGWWPRRDVAPKPNSIWHPFPAFLPVLHNWTILCCISGRDSGILCSRLRAICYSLLQKGLWAWGPSSPPARKPPEGAKPSEVPFKQTYLGLLEQLGVSSLEDKCCLLSAIFN